MKKKDGKDIVEKFFWGVGGGGVFFIGGRGCKPRP